MGVGNPYKKQKEAGEGKAVAAAPQEQKRPVSRRKAAASADDAGRKKDVIVNGEKTRMTEKEIEAGKAKTRSIEKSSEMLGKFLPENVEYLKEHLGMDLTDSSVYTKEVLEDLYYGRVTQPLSLTVTPQAYDAASKSRVDMPKVDMVASVRMILPFDKERNQLAIDPSKKETRLYVATYPHRAMCERASGEETHEVTVPGKKETDEKIEFTPQERMALEGIGIDTRRLYGGRYNSLSYDTKQAIKAGEDFVYDGTLNTEVGQLNVSGIARLETVDGKVVAVTEPLVTHDELKEKRDEDLVLDIVGVRNVGSIEVDIYERDSAGKVQRDEKGMPLLNAGAWDLVEYGQAMQPMTGYVHGREWDEEKHSYKDVAEKVTLQVSECNGGLVVTRMKASEGEEPKIQSNLKDGRLQRGRDVYDFASDRDREDYVHGRGGVVKDVRVKDYTTGKITVYDAFAVADNRKGGFARFFTPEQSQALMARRAERDRIQQANEERKARRSALLRPKKQGFSPKH